ncbi:MAG: hypothetical protein AAGF12_03680 [Myxococcota bacterium]
MKHFSFLIAGLLVAACGRSHSDEDPGAVDPGAVDPGLNPTCPAEPVGLGPAEPRFGMDLVATDAGFVAGFMGPDGFELRRIGGAGVVASATLEIIEPEPVLNRIDPPELFATSRGIEIVRATNDGVILEVYDSNFARQGQEMVAVGERYFRSAQVTDEASENAVAVLAGRGSTDRPFHVALPHANEFAFDGEDFLIAGALRGSRQLWGMSVDGGFAEDPMSLVWDPPRFDVRGGSRLVPRSYRAGRHAGVFVEGDHDRLRLLIEGEEPLAIESAGLDAAIDWDGQAYTLVLAGSGISLIGVTPTAALATDISEAEVVASATEARAPAIHTLEPGEHGLSWIDEGQAYFLRYSSECAE